MEEGQVIGAYKDYEARHFGNDYTLAGLCVAHFDPAAYDTQDKLYALEQYLKSLEAMSRVLSKAAFLRQYHYEHFITNEDPGHKHWREGLNDVAADSRRKLGIWQRIRDEELDEAIALYEAEPLPPVFCRAHKIENPDRPKKRAVKIIHFQRPKISKKERKRRKKERDVLEHSLLDKEVNRALETKFEFYAALYNVDRQNASLNVTEFAGFVIRAQYDKARYLLSNALFLPPPSGNVEPMMILLIECVFKDDSESTQDDVLYLRQNFCDFMYTNRNFKYVMKVLITKLETDQWKDADHRSLIILGSCHDLELLDTYLKDVAPERIRHQCIRIYWLARTTYIYLQLCLLKLGLKAGDHMTWNDTQKSMYHKLPCLVFGFGMIPHKFKGYRICRMKSDPAMLIPHLQKDIQSQLKCI